MDRRPNVFPLFGETEQQAARDAFAPDLRETRHLTVCNCTARQLATGEHHRLCYLSAPEPTLADDWREFWSDVAAAPAHHAAFALLVLASVAVLFVAPLIVAGWAL